MAWYDTGTVNVTANSATVTGVGTQWLAGARRGEAFVAPDGRLYEVLNIASNTSLTLTKPYRGPTATGQQYALAPMQGYTKELADRAAQLIDRFGAAVELAENAVPNSRVMTSQYDTGANRIALNTAFGLGSGGMETLTTFAVDKPSGLYRAMGDGTASPTANGPVGTGNSALTVRVTRLDSNTAHFIAQVNGGAPAARKLYFGQRNSTSITWQTVYSDGNLAIVGDVGAGAAMQSGQNSNGRWWRFQSGLQICTFSSLKIGYQDLPVIAGSLWRCRSIPWTFPAAFIAGGHVAVGAHAEHARGTAWAGIGDEATTTTATSFSIYTNYQASNEPNISVFAIGAYK